MDAPCEPWIEIEDICSCDVSEREESVVLRAIGAASAYLWRRSGRRFGVCETTIRPCGGGGLGVQWVAYGTAGGARPIAPCGSCTGSAESCPCGHRLLVLPNAPVVAVSEVKVDGVILTAGVDYRVVDGRALVRVGEQAWPCCQRLDLDDTEDRTMSVTYTWGIALDDGAILAAQALACQIIAACPIEGAEGTCTLPPDVVNVVREGLTYALDDDVSDLLDPLRALNVPLVDQWLASVNPKGLTSAASFINVQRGPRSHTVA